jgi:hypothetical protein
MPTRAVHFKTYPHGLLLKKSIFLIKKVKNLISKP